MALQPLLGGDLGRVIHRPIGYGDAAAGVREIEWGERQEDDDGGERMEEDAELEEGEAVERETSGYDNLAYIDDKVDALLGQYKKDFEGSLHADKLGSKYGGYGSFLPTHVRDLVHAGTPRAPATRVPTRSRPVEGALERARRMSATGNASGPASERSFKASPNGTGPKANSQINGVSHPPDGLANATAAAKTKKKDNSGPVNQKKGRSLTPRVSSQGEGLGKVEKKAMYNGFGLDHSSSPSDEDPDDETSASEDEGSLDGSPLTMIRRMTLHELPPGGLLSPLLDLLSEPLDRTAAKQASDTNLRKKVGGPGAPLPKPDLGLTSAGAAKLESRIGKDERAAVMREKAEKVGGEKAKGKAIDRRVPPGELPESAKLSKKDGESDSRLGTEGGGGVGPKASHRISKKDGAKDAEVKGDKTDREVAVDGRDRLGKEGENAKDLGRNSTGKERSLPVPVADLPTREGVLDLPGSEGKDVWKASEEPVGRDYNFKSASMKDTKEALKEPSKRKSAVGSKDTLKAQKDDALQNDVQKQQFKKDASKFVETAGAIEREGSKDVPPAEGKKKGKESNRESQAQKELKGRAGEAVKQPRRDTKKEGKELMLRDADDGEDQVKDAGKFGGVGAASKERLKDVKRDGTDQGPKIVKVGRKPGRKPGREPKSLQKSKTRDVELARDIPVGNSTGGPRPPPPQTVVPLLAPGVPTTEAPAPAPAAGAILPAGQLVLDSWVQCDNCNKWRLAVPGIDVDALLDKKWVCKMMKWLPGFNNCSFEEEVTTAAVYERLGRQNPALAPPLLDPGLQPQHPVVPALAQADVLQDSKVLDSKPGRVQKSNSKKKLNTSNLSQNGKINDMSSVKSKSLNDVVHQPLDRSSDKIGQEVLGTEDMFHTRGGADRRKMKEKDKPKRMRGSIGAGIREEERNRAAVSMHQDHDGDFYEKTPAKFLAGTEPDTGVEGSTWNGYLDPESKKRQRGAFSHGGGKADSMGGKRKKKTDSSQENDDLQAKKKFKIDESRDWRGKYEANALHEAHDDDGDMQSRQDISNEDGESPNRAVISSRQQHAIGGVPAGQQPPRKGKAMSGTKRDRRYNSRRDDSPPVDVQAAASRVVKNNSWDVNYERDSIEKQESSNSDEHNYQKESSGRRLKDSGMNRRVESKDRGSQQDAAKRAKRSETDTGIDHVEKKREVVLKPEFNLSLAGPKEGTTDQKNGQPKKFGVPSEMLEFRLSKGQGPMEGQQQAAAVGGAGALNDEKSGDKRGKSSTRLFDEVSEVARTYAQHPSLQGAAEDESPNEVSPLPDLGRGYNNEEEVGQEMQKVAESRPRSQTSMASKVSFSGEGESSAFESKRGSPIESTVSSSPLRSSKAGDQAAASGPPRVTEGVQDDHNTMMDTSNGRARGDDHYAMSNSREGPNCRKFERGRSGGDEYTFFEESRERERERAGSTSYVPADRYDRHPRGDDRYRERGDSVDRYRDRVDNNNRENNRDSRYERRTGGRDDRSRERERDRDILRDRGSSRENWPSSADRGGGGGGDSARDERHSSREKVASRQDWGGRPCSRESRLDKQGSLNWQDDPGVVKEGSHEGRDRGIEDEKPEIRSHTGGHPDEGEVGPVPDIQKDGSKLRYEKLDLGGSKDTKPTLGRLPPSGQASQGWEGDNRLGVSSVRKEPDGCATRNGLETAQTFVNNRNRGEGLQSGPGSTGVRGRGNHVDGGSLDSGKLDKDRKKVTEEDAPTRGGVARAPGSNAQAAKELMREATDLKHRADIKVKGNEGEFTDLYLWAACKFLKAAHLLELPTSEGVRQGDLKQALDLYNDTANLCSYCAGTYERRRDLPAAALARICVAVARFRAVMGKTGSFKSDCQELHTTANSATASGTHVAAVLTPPQAIFTRTSEKSTSHGAGVPSVVGESPSSSSASDLDNLNNHGNPGDKGFTATAVKGNQQSVVPGSTSGAGDLVPQRLHENFKRTLCTGLDFVAMMESWTRAQSATIAAEAACAGDPHQQDGMAHVRRVGEIGFFGNMEVVLMEVLNTLEALGR